MKLVIYLSLIAVCICLMALVWLLEKVEERTRRIENILDYILESCDDETNGEEDKNENPFTEFDK